MMKPKVSIIIPAYNIENYIERCLESLVNQSLKEIEIIVVNDGSTDGTCTRIEKFLSIDGRVKLVNQENKGAIEARKTGLSIAKGKYILFVDGDDWLELNALEILYDNATKNNSDIVLYPAFRVDNDGKNLFQVYEDCKEYSLQEVFLGKIVPSLWSKFIKLDYINSNNIQFPSNISFAEDLATTTSLFIHNPKVSLENKALYNYYERFDSTTSEINSKVLDVDEAFIFIKQLLSSHGIYNKYKDSFKYCIYDHMFFMRCIRNDKVPERYRKILYKKYKAYNIDMKYNPYIKKHQAHYPFWLKVRVKIYCHSYRLGRLYDNFRIFVKGENDENS
ncbi:glycosyltransferase family 2 protein [Turicibacter bilis]|uniref:glycosyltransferase family 2 protein n=1 Tax=Turicibacter bilis TaxID=2735723 RepID=UPI0031BB255C